MTKVSTIGRRTALGLGLATGAAAVAPRRARAQAPKEVKIAMLVPLSGPWARQGILEKFGAEMAIDDINNAGGIKALGGAKLRLMEFDTGDSAEKAKDAAQRMLAQEPDLVGGFGCWLSTFTLAATEVTERAGLPWLTLSYSDLITGRGFKYVFQSSPTADKQAEDLVPMIIDLATFLVLVVAFVGYDRRAAGGRRMHTLGLRLPAPTPIDLARRRAGVRRDRIGRGVRDARAV